MLFGLMSSVGPVPTSCSRRVAGRLVAILARALEASECTEARNSLLHAHPVCTPHPHRRNHAHNAGGIHKRSLRMVRAINSQSAASNFFLAAAHTSISCRSVEKLSRCSAGPEDSAPLCPTCRRRSESVHAHVQGVAMGYSTRARPQRKRRRRWLTEPATLCFSQSSW